MPAGEHVGYERDLQVARTALGAETFTAEWAAGAALDIETVVDEWASESGAR